MTENRLASVSFRVPRTNALAYFTGALMARKKMSPPTPDIPCIIDSDDEGFSSRRSVVGVSPPMSASPPEIIMEHSKSASGFQSSQPVKRGRKKQPHPQQVNPLYAKAGNTKGGSITVPLTSCFTSLD
jgi:hypothetical protein